MHQLPIHACESHKLDRVADRRGITRIEFLLIALVGTFLMALFWPSVQAAREVARRYGCQNNLRQLGQALHSYHDTHTSLPPAAVWGSEGLDLPDLVSHKNPTPVHVTRQNWLWYLLPNLDELSLANEFDWAFPAIHENNRDAREAELPVMKCPTDTNNTWENRYKLELPNRACVEFARGNYAINGGSEYVPARFGNLSNPGPPENRFLYSEEQREFQWWGNGIAGFNKCFSFDEFENGLSTTVGFEEIRAGLLPTDPRGVWAFGQIGGSITWGHGITGDDGGPNHGSHRLNFAESVDSGYIGADDILGGPTLAEKLSVGLLEAERMEFCRYCNENAQATARSQHPGGVQLVMLDGSVRFVSDEVDTGLWHVMHSRETPSDVFKASFDQDLLGAISTDDTSTVDAEYGEVASMEALPNRIENSLGMEFIRIPAGEFVMGLPNKGNRMPYPWDAVAHNVRITDDFFLGVHEVTQKQYFDVIGENPSWHAPTGGGHGVITLTDTSNCPVEEVSWEDATEFCRRLSNLPVEKAAGRTYRLPTEAEWEYACRAGQMEPFELDVGWTDASETGQIASKVAPETQLNTESVGTYPPNAYGIFDMCGNVYEWVSDYRVEGYYLNSPLKDPQGPASGYLRVIRGWYWVAIGIDCKVYVAVEPSKGSRFVGFRVVCE